MDNLTRRKMEVDDDPLADGRSENRDILSLVHTFHRLGVDEDRVQKGTYNHTRWQLHPMHPNDADAFGVYAGQVLPPGTLLGTIEGERVYSWEVEPSPHVLYLDEELAIDCTQQPRCILSLVREGFCDGVSSNCQLVTFHHPHDPGTLHVGMMTTCALAPGEELIYHHPYPAAPHHLSELALALALAQSTSSTVG